MDKKVLEKPLRIEGRPHAVEELFLDDIETFKLIYNFSDDLVSSASEVVKLAKRLNSSDAYSVPVLLGYIPVLYVLNLMFCVTYLVALLIVGLTREGSRNP